MSKGKTPKNASPRVGSRRSRVGMRSTAPWCRPIYLSTIFAFEKYRTRAIRLHTVRQSTRDQLGDALADLEDGAGAGGHVHRAVGTYLDPGDPPSGARSLAPYDCYGGTYRCARRCMRRASRG